MTLRIAALGLLVLLGSTLGPDSAQAQDGAPGHILRIFSVGGVLTEDGTLWQYSPSRKWQTIDEAFADQDRETHILPLPVPAREIEEMMTFGFFLTRAGELWLYDLEDDRWKNLDSPE